MMTQMMYAVIIHCGMKMRITIDIEEKTLREVQRATGVTKKSPAVQAALKEYIRQEKCRKLIGMVKEGRVDYGMTNDALEAAMGDEVD